MQNEKMSGILITLAGAICWGISGCFGQYLFQETEIYAEWLVAVRLLLAGTLLVSLGFVQQKREIVQIFRNADDRKRLVIFSLFGVLACQYTYFAAIQYSNAGTATVLQSLSCVLILGVLCFREKRAPKRYESVAIACALIGTVLLSTHGDFSSMSLSTRALLFGLGSAVGAVLYNFLAGDMVNRYGIYVVVGFAMLISGVMMWVIVRPWQVELAWNGKMILAILGVVIVGTAVAFSLYLKGVSMVGPLLASLLATIEPVVAIVVSFMFLGSNFHAMDFVGFVLILGTVIGLSLKQRQNEKSAR